MRLTEKVKEPLPHYATKNIQFDLPKIIDKLGQLEDIEEWLDFDLKTAFNGLINGIYVKDSDGDIHLALVLYISIVGLVWSRTDYVKDFRTAFWEEYGNTWALTKEELK